MRTGANFSAVAAALVLAVGCTGSIGQSGEPGTDTGSPGNGTGNNTGKPGTGTGTGVVPGSPGDPNSAGPMPLRRMTHVEFNNTVRDLLGDTSNPATAFPPDYDPGFLYPRAQLVSLQDVDTLKDAALALGKGAEKNAATLAPCAAGTAEDTCAKTFINTFGLKAYRRPVASDEADRLFALYTLGRTTLALTYAGAIGLLVEGIVQTPTFLYHWELGNNAPTMEGKVARLNPYETASRLSYFIYNSLPDQPLFDAAAANQLSTPADLETQARRMLADSKGANTVANFVDAWLTLSDVPNRPKDPNVYPQFNDDLKGAMVGETHALVASIMKGDQKLSSLLTQNVSSVDQALAAVYGVSGVKGTTMMSTTLNTAQRSGLLTRAAFLTVTGATDGSHPVKRGRRVYERFFCGVLPPPPNVVPAVATAASSVGKTTRQRFEDHDKNPCSTACHSLMDPVGFFFENYDGIGQFRTMDNGGVVDATSTIEIDGTKHNFNNAIELSQALSTSTDVANCFATQWFRFATDRTETDDDQASLTAIATAFKKTNSITDAMIGVATSRSFRYRSPATGEMLQ
ncbi:MAG TPA: DUF1592 domain-containing protein [Polyangia bacterium]|jgi:hypothetical protein